LRSATGLSVAGDWTFEANVTVIGAAALEDKGSPQTVLAGTILGPGLTD
jgi:UTP--glucose-1-phosphate uridylyltransferase